MTHVTPSTPRPASTTRPVVPTDRLPRHIAVIMDGNGRWAQQRQRPRIEGHQAGARAVREIVTECARLELDALTLYSFSVENWKRPQEEIGALMTLCHEYLINERDEMLTNNVRFRQVGRREGLPSFVLDQIDACVEATADCTGLTLALAMNYGSRTEITDAVRRIAAAVARGGLDPADITEETVSDNLYTAGLPDPDLLIRTAGEYRLSNYLLWQSSYAELYVTPVLWPDFTNETLHEALRAYAARDRRFGGLSDED